MIKVLAKSLCVAGMGLLLFSCVPARQYQELQSRQNNCREELELVKQKYRNLNEQNTEMSGRLSLLEEETQKLKDDTIALHRRLRMSKQKLKSSEELNKELV